MRPNEIERSLKPSVPNGLHSTQYLSTGIHVMLIPRLLRIEHWFAMKRIMRYLDSTSSYTFGTRAPTYLWMSWYSDVDLCDTQTKENPHQYMHSCSSMTTIMDEKEAFTQHNVVVEVKFVAFTSTTQEVVWSKRLLDGLLSNRKVTQLVLISSTIRQTSLQQSTQSTIRSLSTQISSTNMLETQYDTKLSEFNCLYNVIVAADPLTKILKMQYVERHLKSLGFHRIDLYTSLNVFFIIMFLYLQLKFRCMFTI